MNSPRLQELYRDHAATLVLYARQWCSAPDDALQEAMLELARCQPQPSDAVAWLYTTTKRRAMNIARADSRRQAHQRHAAEERSEWFTGSKTGDPSNADADLADAVVAGLDTLADDERELIVARVWGNLAFEQLGALLGCSTSSAHRRYHAALVKLRSVVEDTAEETAEKTVEETAEKTVDESQANDRAPLAESGEQK